MVSFSVLTKYYSMVFLMSPFVFVYSVVYEYYYIIVYIRIY